MSISELLFCSLIISRGLASDNFQQSETTPDPKSQLRHHLREVVTDAFSDAIQTSSESNSDEYQNGISESDQQIILLGERVFGDDVSNFCGALGAQKFSHVPVVYRDGVHFTPTKPLPMPISNMSLHLPSRWFRDPLQRSPFFYICYEGDSFLKMHQIETVPSDWSDDGKFWSTRIRNAYNERCRIRELLIVLDDYWNKRNLLPRNVNAWALLETSYILPRVVFTEECDPELGIDQPCCLWRFHFTDKFGTHHNFHRCFGSIPNAAVKSSQIPDELGELLVRGMMTRRFISPPSRVCRAIEYRPMVVRTADGISRSMNRLDAVKCGAFY